MADKCDIKGCTEDAESICENKDCSNKICDMHTYVTSGENGRNILVCETCYGK